MFFLEKFTLFEKLIHIFFDVLTRKAKTPPSPSPLFDGWAYISFPPAFVFSDEISLSIL